MNKKLAVIFPGVGYHTDKPLLYYGKKLAAARGYEILEVSYGELPSGIKGSREKMLEAFEAASDCVAGQLCQVDFAGCEDVLFISKSIGTAVAAAFALHNHISALQVYYTPVEECRKRHLPLYETAGANHSLETGNVQKDLKNLAEIMRQTERYIAGIL